MERRPATFTWVTWLTGLLSGEKHCRWALWCKTHYAYDKIERDGNLQKWAAEHAALVAARRAELEADGWTVQLEGQNKFFLQGQATKLSGQPDIIATRDGIPAGRAFTLTSAIDDVPVAKEILVDDCKTGQHRDSDVQQVLVYMHFLPEAKKALFKDRVVRGRVTYGDGAHVNLGPTDATRATQKRIADLLKEAGGSMVPPRTPSYGECRFCDIADCQDRVTEAVEAIETEAF